MGIDSILKAQFGNFDDVAMRNTVLIGVLALLVLKYISYARGKVHLPGPIPLPIVGNLMSLGHEAAFTFHEWSKKYGGVFKVTLGEREIIVINTAKGAKELLSDQGGVYISRPEFHNVHKIMGSTAGLSIGTSPWDDSCKRKRKAAATALNKANVETYLPMVDRETLAMIEDFYNHGKGGKVELDPAPYCFRFALNTSLSVNYGCRLGEVGDDLLKEIIHVEFNVSENRSTTASWANYIPLVRALPAFKGKQLKHMEDIRARRDKYMDLLLNDLKTRIKNGTDVPCITGSVLKDPDAKLNAKELGSLCLSMVSAGLDTLGNTMNWSLGYLAQHPAAWEKAYSEINRVCGGEIPNAEEEIVEYITALHREASRFFSVLKLSLPRATLGDSEYNGIHIPSGTTVFLNAWAVHHDKDRYGDTEVFRPERFLEEKATDADGAQAHYSFGAGRRMCAGVHLANREMYSAFARLIYFFKLEAGDVPYDIDPYTACMNPNGLASQPKNFKIRLVARDPEVLEQWITDEKSRNELKIASSISNNNARK